MAIMFFIHTCRALDEKQSENDTLTPIIQMNLHRYYPHHPKDTTPKYYAVCIILSIRDYFINISDFV